VNFLDVLVWLRVNCSHKPQLPQLEGGAQSNNSIDDFHVFQILELQTYVALLESTGAQQEAEIADLKAQLRDLRDQPEVQMLELRLEMQGELERKLNRPSGLH
jgi:hypothetical protein